MLNQGWDCFTMAPLDDGFLSLRGVGPRPVGIETTHQGLG